MSSEVKENEKENPVLIETDAAWISARLPEIPENANKFTRGRLLLAAGSYGMAGAAIMAARAALRSGVGYLELFIPASLYPIITSSVPEAVCTVYDPENEAEIREKLRSSIQKCHAVAAGPGLGNNRDRVVSVLLSLCDKPMVLDADALNYLAGADDLPVFQGDAVLTPHEGEAARLLKRESSEIREDRVGSLFALSEKYRASVLLKGPETLISMDDGEIYVNRTGNAGMARAGSGDVLTGIIGSLAAQGMRACDAAAGGAWIHGSAGDLMKEKMGIRSYTPEDMIEVLPYVFSALDSFSEKSADRESWLDFNVLK